MMKLKLLILASLVALAWAESVPGFDISHWQETFNYTAAYDSGARFAIIKATEHINFIDKAFPKHWAGCTNAGLIRGAYHFAHPGESTGGDQADYFIAHGGGWTNDGITLPGMLDLESGGKGQCWNITVPKMVEWIQQFSDRYEESEGRKPMIYTNPSWWKACTGNTTVFATNKNPLVLARWAAAPGEIPGGWPAQTIWQYNDKYPHGGDSDLFDGSMEELIEFATG